MRFGFFVVLHALGFQAPVVNQTFPLYIKDKKSGSYYYFDAKTHRYVDDEREVDNMLPRGVVEDVLEEPADYADMYELSVQRVWADGSIIAASAADTSGTEVPIGGFAEGATHTSEKATL